jgi:RNase P subunit RPR2
MSLARKPPLTRAVICHKCRYRVTLSTTNRLPDEFTLRCPNCGRRHFYQAKEVFLEEEAGVRSRQLRSKRAS